MTIFYLDIRPSLLFPIRNILLLFYCQVLRVNAPNIEEIRPSFLLIFCIFTNKGIQLFGGGGEHSSQSLFCSPEAKVFLVDDDDGGGE